MVPSGVIPAPRLFMPGSYLFARLYLDHCACFFLSTCRFLFLYSLMHAVLVGIPKHAILLTLPLHACCWRMPVYLLPVAVRCLHRMLRSCYYTPLPDAPAVRTRCWRGPWLLCPHRCIRRAYARLQEDRIDRYVCKRMAQQAWWACAFSQRVQAISRAMRGAYIPATLRRILTSRIIARCTRCMV